MRVAVIGAGSIGLRHARNARILRHSVVVLDTQLAARARAQAEGFEVCNPATPNGPEAVWETAYPDAAIIATPADQHLVWLATCVLGGTPALVEKPLGVVADLDALRALRPTKPVMVGYQLRFHPALQALKASVPRPTSGGFYLDCDMKTWPGHRYEHILLEGSHELDAALFCGAPHDVSHVITYTDTRVTFWLGEEGRWLIDLDGACSDYVRHWMLGPSDAYPTKFHSPEELGPQMYVDELAHFLRAVEGGPIAPGCTLEEGIAVLEVIEQVKA